MYYYIVNPAAGNSLVGSIQEKLKARLHEMGIDGEFNKTIGSGDAAKIAKQALAQGFKTIVAIGGDETVNEVVTAVCAGGKPRVAVGIIPVGKQNLMARHLGIGDWQHACDVLAARRLQTYQLMEVNGKPFIYDCTLLAAGSWQPAPNEPEPFWQELINRATPSRGLTPFTYLLDLDRKYKVRGEAGQIIVSNQKFLDTKLGNDLILHIYNAESKAEQKSKIRKFVQRFKRETQHNSQFSQLHGTNITIECHSPAEAIIDGQKVDGTKFSISLSDNEIQLITNRDTTD